MSEKDMDRFVDMSLRTTQFLGTVIGVSITSSLVEFLKFRLADRNDKALVKYYKSGGKLSASMCSPSEMNAISAKLKENGVVHSCIIQEREADHTKIGIILYPEGVEARVKGILDKYRAEHTIGGMTKKEILWNKSNGHLRKVKNLDKATAMLLEEHAKKSGIDYYIESSKVDRFNVVYCAQDQKSIDKIKAETAVDLAGQAGKALRKQLEYEDMNTQKIFEKITDKNESPFVVVDLDGEEIHVDSQTVKIVGKENCVLQRNTGETGTDARTEEIIKNALSHMRTPVYMNEQSYEKYKGLLIKEKKQFLAELEKEHGRPQYTKEEYTEIIRKNALREEYIAAITRENGMEVSESPFSNNELRGAVIQDVLTEEVYKPDKEVIQEARKIFIELEDVSEDIPINIERDADKILDGEEPEKDRENEIDYEREADLDRMYDLNGDGFNNEFEERD